MSLTSNAFDTVVPDDQLGAGAEGVANRQVIAVIRQRLAAGGQVVETYQEPGLAWLERQAEAAEDLLAERRAGDHFA